MNEQNDGFGKDYSPEKFWDKTRQFAGVAGKEVIEKALQLFYAAQSPGTPGWAKTAIFLPLSSCSVRTF